MGAVIKELEVGLAPDVRVAEGIDKEVKETIGKATRVTEKATGFVRKVLSGFDTSKGSARTAKTAFEERVSKMSSKAVEKLMENDNITALVTAYKDPTGKEFLTEAYFRKALDKRLGIRAKSKEYFGKGIAAEAPSGKDEQSIVGAVTAINDAVAAEAYLRDTIMTL